MGYIARCAPWITKQDNPIKYYVCLSATYIYDIPSFTILCESSQFVLRLNVHCFIVYDSLAYFFCSCYRRSQSYFLDRLMNPLCLYSKFGKDKNVLYMQKNYPSYCYKYKLMCTLHYKQMVGTVSGQGRYTRCTYCTHKNLPTVQFFIPLL